MSKSSLPAWALLLGVLVKVMGTDIRHPCAKWTDYHSRPSINQTYYDGGVEKQMPCWDLCNPERFVPVQCQRHCPGFCEKVDELFLAAVSTEAEAPPDETTVAPIHVEDEDKRHGSHTLMVVALVVLFLIIFLILGFVTGRPVWKYCKRRLLPDTDQDDKSNSGTDVEEVIVMQQRGQPGNQPQDQPGNQPQDQPGNQPQGQPGNQPQVQPGNQPGNQPQDQPGNQPQVQPGNQPQDQPGNQPQDQPGNQQEEEPADQSVQQPQAQATPDVLEVNSEAAMFNYEDEQTPLLQEHSTRPRQASCDDQALLLPSSYTAYQPIHLHLQENNVPMNVAIGPSLETGPSYSYEPQPQALPYLN